MPDLEKLANIVGAETIKKIYEDGFSGSVQELGKMLTDFIKAARLFTVPFQLAASQQDRFTKYFEKVRNSVPEENQMEAPGFISGPIIERLKYLEESNYLTDLYLNLLSRAIDKERINEAHPAFYHIIDQLSPDEAYLLFKLRDKEIIVTTTEYENPQRLIVEADFSLEEFTFPENFQMYYSHLESLNLIDCLFEPVQHVGIENNLTILTCYGKIEASRFGKLFIKACISEKGFIPIT